MRFANCVIAVSYTHLRKNVWTVAKNTWEKGLTYAYRDRRNKKRTFRALWIQRINAAARLDGMSYSQLMGALHKAGIEINRKVLADLAVKDVYKRQLQSYTKNDMQQVFWQKNCQYLTFVKCFLHISCNTIRFCRVIFFVSLNDS